LKEEKQATTHIGDSKKLLGWFQINFLSTRVIIGVDWEKMAIIGNSNHLTRSNLTFAKIQLP